MSLEPLRSVSIVALLLSRLAARSSSSVAESMDLPQKLGNDESEPRRRRAADMEGAWRWLKLEELEALTASSVGL